MSLVWKVFRVTFFLAIYFFAALLIIALALQSWSDGSQVLFALGAPIFLVWWQERRRSRKIAATNGGAKSSETTETNSALVAPPNAYEKRVERERERTREANVSRASAATQAYSPPKQDYAEIVRAGKSAAPALAAAAERKQSGRVASSRSSRTKKSGWVPSSETASVAGRNIGGMVYVGTPPLLNSYGYRDKCASSDNLGHQSVLSFGGSGSSLIKFMRFQFRGASAA